MTAANIDLVIDCHDLDGLYEFWAAALGYHKVGIKGEYALLMPSEQAFPPLVLQKVPESKTVKNRMHLDIRYADVETKAKELEAIGARRIDVGQPNDAYWIPMSDPEGNEFCVCPGVPLTLLFETNAMTKEDLDRVEAAASETEGRG